MRVDSVAKLLTVNTEAFY